MRGDERIENAISLAKKYFKVPKLIQAREFHSEYLDKKSVVTYLMSLYIGMAYHSSSLSSSSKKSIRSNPDPEQLQVSCFYKINVGFILKNPIKRLTLGTIYSKF
jgi:hypothetical protein